MPNSQNGSPSRDKSLQMSLAVDPSQSIRYAAGQLVAARPVTLRESAGQLRNSLSTAASAGISPVRLSWSGRRDCPTPPVSPRQLRNWLQAVSPRAPADWSGCPTTPVSPRSGWSGCPVRQVSPRSTGCCRGTATLQVGRGSPAPAGIPPVNWLLSRYSTSRLDRPPTPPVSPRSAGCPKRCKTRSGWLGCPTLPVSPRSGCGRGAAIPGWTGCPTPPGLPPVNWLLEGQIFQAGQAPSSPGIGQLVAELQISQVGQAPQFGRYLPAQLVAVERQPVQVGRGCPTTPVSPRSTAGWRDRQHLPGWSRLPNSAGISPVNWLRRRGPDR